MNMQITYGDHTIDYATAPESSARAMLSRGTAHYLGNEQSAKVGPNSSWATKFEKDNGRKPSEDDVEAQKAVNLEKALRAIAEGTIGTSRGPKLDPVEAEMDRIAEREVWDTLVGATLCKKNKKPKDEQEFTFLNGDKFTFEMLVNRRLEKHGDRIKGLAEEKVAAERKAREVAQAEAKTVVESGVVDVEGLGL